MINDLNRPASPRPRRGGALIVAGRNILDRVLPPRCLGCGEVIAGDAALCASCWGKITFLGAPCCDACGQPFTYAVGDGALCASCLGRRPVYARARAVFSYDHASRGLVLALKHGDRSEGVAAYAHWLARAGRELLEDADLIVPVPLHWTRLLFRRYNQSALLARALAAVWCAAHPHQDPPVTYLPEVLVRTRRTPPQGKFDRTRRANNVRGAFVAPPARLRRIAAKRIVLIDDVLTTGATASACARVLLAAGAARVDVLTLARVLTPGI
ncbi:ComF family protein [Varunaivibrio sulfuroxidans]|uniref:ComF family protein n=1 Tax=Varunaivibrio sulfuroxidans TaxID=1773489 RepID=UPI002AC36B7E|nr:ComF family protein [Varunaivibrio sulfuroxidans]